MRIQARVHGRRGRLCGSDYPSRSSVIQARIRDREPVQAEACAAMSRTWRCRASRVHATCVRFLPVPLTFLKRFCAQATPPTALNCHARPRYGTFNLLHTMWTPHLLAGDLSCCGSEPPAHQQAQNQIFHVTRIKRRPADLIQTRRQVTSGAYPLPPSASWARTIPARRRHQAGRCSTRTGRGAPRGPQAGETGRALQPAARSSRPSKQEDNGGSTPMASAMPP